MSTSQSILFVTEREDDFKPFIAQIQAAAKQIALVSSVQDAIDAADKTAPALVIIDDKVENVSGLEIASRLLQVNAFINTALVSDMDHDLFHEKSEGLGVLTQLPLLPSASDAKALLSQLEQLNSIAP